MTPNLAKVINDAGKIMKEKVRSSCFPRSWRS